MKITIVFACILVIAKAADIDWSKIRPIPAPNQRPLKGPQGPNNSKAESRIVGGQFAYPHQFPYQAALIIDDTYFCGGSVISDHYVLTAAHCAEGADHIIVVLGAHNILENEPTQRVHYVANENIKVHELWDPVAIKNDIALLFIVEGTELTPGVIEAVKLPRFSDQANLFALKPTQTSGWGKTSDLSNTISPILKYADSWVTLPLTCKLRFPGSILDSHICMDGTLKSTCNGDSGGPLVTVFNGETIQIGTTSFGLVFCSLTWPSVFTRITFFLTWIDENTQYTIVRD